MPAIDLNDDDDASSSAETVDGNEDKLMVNGKQLMVASKTSHHTFFGALTNCCNEGFTYLAVKENSSGYCFAIGHLFSINGINYVFLECTTNNIDNDIQLHFVRQTWLFGADFSADDFSEVKVFSTEVFTLKPISDNSMLYHTDVNILDYVLAYNKFQKPVLPDDLQSQNDEALKFTQSDNVSSENIDQIMINENSTQSQDAAFLVDQGSKSQAHKKRSYKRKAVIDAHTSAISKPNVRIAAKPIDRFDPSSVVAPKKRVKNRKVVVDLVGESQKVVANHVVESHDSLNKKIPIQIMK